MSHLSAAGTRQGSPVDSLMSLYGNNGFMSRLVQGLDFGNFSAPL